MRLPLALEPAPGEALVSYLTRRAAQHGCTLATLGDHIGLRQRGYWPGLLGVRIDSGLAGHVADPLGLHPGAVRTMHLSRYDQQAFDLTGLTHRSDLPAIRAVSTRHWVRLSGSSFCPPCLTTDGAWQVRWRLPWSTTCPDHDVFLVRHCPSCRHVPGTNNRLRGSAPARVDAPTDTRLCLYPVDGDVCGTDLTTAPTQRAPKAALDRDKAFTTVFETGRGTVAGADQTALRTVRAWQSAIGLALHLGVTTVPGWGAHRGSEPPPDPVTMHRLLTVTAPVIDAVTVPEAAEVVSGWCTQAGVQSPDAHTFARGMQSAAALTPIADHVLATTGRAHTRLRRMSDLDGQHRIPVLEYDLDDIPQLVWPCALPEHLQGSTRPDVLILRAVVSMILVRMHGTRTWAEAGTPLGLPATKARGWARYAFATPFGHRQALLEAARATAPLLSSQPHRHAWAQRPPITGNGLTAFAAAQNSACRRSDLGASWCPCPAQPACAGQVTGVSA